MRAFVLVPIILAVAVAAGLGICASVGAQLHLKEAIVATLICLVAGALASAPLMRARGGNQAAIAQAALVGTVVHLFVNIAGAGVVILGHLPLGQSFLYWLAALYWITLVVLV